MQEIRNEELKGRLLELSKTSSSTADRCCLQQVLALLENYETRVEEIPQDSQTGVKLCFCNVHAFVWYSEGPGFKSQCGGR
jgi:hypothetical protein